MLLPPLDKVEPLVDALTYKRLRRGKRGNERRMVLPRRISFDMDVLDQAQDDSQPLYNGSLDHRSYCGLRCASIKCTEQLPEACIEQTLDTVRVCYHHALADLIDSLYEVHMAHYFGLLRGFETIWLAMLERVDCFNDRQLLSIISSILTVGVGNRLFAATGKIDISE